MRQQLARCIYTRPHTGAGLAGAGGGAASKHRSALCFRQRWVRLNPALTIIVLIVYFYFLKSNSR